MIFKRKAYAQLKDWKEKYNGKYAALLEGPRRVGKSTIAEEFAKSEYKTYIKVDFSNATKEVLDVCSSISNLDLFFLRLTALYNTKLYERESVILFDEIQLQPKVRQAIKFLVKDGRYDYIETGSLLSIKKNISGIVIPSEEHKIRVYPMDYEEFCLATNTNYDVLEKLYSFKKPIGEITNRTLIRNFRIYLAVGGMPQAVEAYANKMNFSQIDRIKQEIISLYEEDLKKIDPSGRLSKIFSSIPAQLAAKKKNFSFRAAMIKGKTSKDDERIFDLVDSKLVNICYRVFEPSLSLNQSIDMSTFKLYLFDTGLFVTMLFNNGAGEYESIYKKLLSDKIALNLSYLYENMISQMLVASKRKLYYYSWRKKNSTHSYEIDFLYCNKGKITPLEIKSSKITNHESIDKFKEKYSSICGQRYLISAKDYRKMNDLINLPYYLFPSLMNDE